MIIAKLYDKNSAKTRKSGATEKNTFSLYKQKNIDSGSYADIEVEPISDETMSKFLTDDYSVFGLFLGTFSMEINFSDITKNSVPGSFSASLKYDCSLNLNSEDNRRAFVKKLFALLTKEKSELEADEIFSDAEKGKLLDVLTSEMNRDEITANDLIKSGSCVDKGKLKDAFPEWLRVDPIYAYFESSALPPLSLEERKRADNEKDLNNKLLKNSLWVANKQLEDAIFQKKHPIRCQCRKLWYEFLLRMMNSYAKLLFWIPDHPKTSLLLPLILIAAAVIVIRGYSYLGVSLDSYAVQVEICGISDLTPSGSVDDLIKKISAIFEELRLNCSFSDSQKGSVIRTEAIRITKEQANELDKKFRNYVSDNRAIFSMNSDEWESGGLSGVQKKTYSFSIKAALPESNVTIEVMVYGEHELRNNIKEFLVRKYNTFRITSDTAESLQISVELSPEHENNFRKEIREIAEKSDAVCGDGNPIKISAQNKPVIDVGLDIEGLSNEQRSVVSDVFKVSISNETVVTAHLRKDELIKKMQDSRLKKQGLQAEWNKSRDRIIFIQEKKPFPITFIGVPTREIEDLFFGCKVKTEDGKITYIYLQTPDQQTALLEELDNFKELRRVDGENITYEIIANIVLNVEKLLPDDRLIVGKVFGVSFLSETEISCRIGRKSVEEKLQDRRLNDASVRYEWQNGKLVFYKKKTIKEISIVIYGNPENEVRDLLKNCTPQKYEGKTVYTFSGEEQECSTLREQIAREPSLRLLDENKKNEFAALKKITWRADGLSEVEEYIKEFTGDNLSGYFTAEEIQQIKDALRRDYDLHEGGGTITVALRKYPFSCRIRLDYRWNFDEIKKRLTELYKIKGSFSPYKKRNLGTFVDFTIDADTNDAEAVKERMYKELVKVDSSFEYKKEYITVTSCKQGEKE